MFMAKHTIVDGGPHGMWLSNCSDDINSTVCDCAIQVAWKVANTTVEHYHDEGLRGWLDGGMAPPRPRIVLDRLGLNNGTSRNLLRALKNLGLGLDISQRPVIVNISLYFIIICHISYKLVLPFLLLQLDLLFTIALMQKLFKQTQLVKTL